MTSAPTPPDPATAGRAMPPVRRPTRIHFVRHGAVRLDGPERVYGDLEMPLSEEGIAQLERVGEWLASEPVMAVWASDLERARLGAASIARPHGLPVLVDPLWREIHRGAWRGLTWEEIESRWPGGPARFLEDPCGYRGHEGETLADVDGRARRAFERLVVAHDGDTVVVVSHSWTLRCVLSRVLCVPLERAMNLPVDHAAVATLSGSTSGWTLASLRTLSRASGPAGPRPTG